MDDSFRWLLHCLYDYWLALGFLLALSPRGCAGGGLGVSLSVLPSTVGWPVVGCSAVGWPVSLAFPGRLFLGWPVSLALPGYIYEVLVVLVVVVVAWCLGAGLGLELGRISWFGHGLVGVFGFGSLLWRCFCGWPMPWWCP